MRSLQRTARRHLGSGWAFPVRVGPRGGLEYSEGEKNIEESIWILLGTAIGERIMRPELGCGVHDLVFAPNGSTSHADVQGRIRRTLTTHEPRIDLTAVRVEADPDRAELLLIRVDYRVRANNANGNVVYPFFLREGQGL